jgi:hypothetical protein
MNDYKKWQTLGKPAVSADPQPRRKIRCACGYVILVWDANDQQCGCCEREYNCVGQLLAPRSQWGEETGEQFS